MTTVALDDLLGYRRCPEQLFRLRDGNPKANPNEVLYTARLRTLLVRFYGELMGQRLMTEKEVRRSWSTMWQIPVGLFNRTYNTNNASMVNALMTEEEKLLLRGAGVINTFLNNRGLHERISPVIVDEPFSLTLDGITVTGRYDLIFEDRSHHYTIVDWTGEPGRYEHRFDLRYAVMLAAFTQKTGHKASMMIDYIRTMGNYLEKSERTPQELLLQVAEATQIAHALSQDLRYRRPGEDCKSCPFQASCVGVSVVQAKRAGGRPRK